MTCCVIERLSKVWASSVRHFTSQVQLRHADEKIMFGGVLETKKDKKKRERKQTEMGEKLKSVGSDAPDSEAFWLKQSPEKDVRVFKMNDGGKYQEIRKKSPQPITSEPSLDQNPSQKSTGPVLPDIIIRNLTSVPMLFNGENRSLAPVNSTDQMPSVTRILSDTMSEASKAALERWKQKMIAELGEEGFQVYNKEQLSFGARFHMAVKRYLEGGDPVLTDDLEKVWSSVKHVLPHVSHVQLLEAKVSHSQLHYKGVVDCVASYLNVPCVVEWKVSEKQKPSLSNTYDAPVQLSAYLGALSHDPSHRLHLENGLVVVVYKDGSPATVFQMNGNNCLKHWRSWLLRLQSYWTTHNQTKRPMAA